MDEPCYLCLLWLLRDQARHHGAQRCRLKFPRASCRTPLRNVRRQTRSRRGEQPGVLGILAEEMVLAPSRRWLQQPCQRRLQRPGRVKKEQTSANQRREEQRGSLRRESAAAPQLNRLRALPALSDHHEIGEEGRAGAVRCRVPRPQPQEKRAGTARCRVPRPQQPVPNGWRATSWKTRSTIRRPKS